ncbi:MAG TPA: DUF2059 domain-containing protein [Humisphaera sp.]|jgi:hypothetical protein|nr:DUF2059 domain-containing protein [Humisphaera sp.]
MRKPWHILFLALGLSSAGVLLSSCSGAAGNAQSTPMTPQQAEDAAFAKDVRHLLQINGSEDMGLRIINQIVVTSKRGNPTVPQKFFEDFGRQIDPDDLFNYLTPIYTRHFTHDEVRQLIAFYESPVGAKLIAQMAAINDETMLANSQWSDALSQKLAAEMHAKGYLRI